MKKKGMKMDSVVKTILGGAAGGAVKQVVQGTLLKGKNTMYADLGAIAVGAVLPALIKMNGVNEMSAGLVGAGAAGLIANAVPSLGGTPFNRFNNALYGTGQARYRQSIISSKPQKKSRSSVLL